MRQTDALAIMCKAPVPGRVKTRLVPPLTHEQAAGLYACFLEDIFAVASRLEGVDRYAAVTPPEAWGVIEEKAGEGVGVIVQRGVGLGERMYNVFTRLSGEGYERVALIGSDSPGLGSEVIARAYTLLGRSGKTVVVGPAHDGGYYLIAMSRPERALFEGVPWSTPGVLDATLKRAASAGLEVELLEPFHDMDTPADLCRLRNNPHAPASAEYLEKMVEGGLNINLQGSSR